MICLLLLFSFSQALRLELTTHQYVNEKCEQRNDTIFKVQIPCQRWLSGYLYTRIKVNHYRYCVVIDSGSSSFWVIDHDTQVEKFVNVIEGSIGEQLDEEPSTTPLTGDEFDNYFDSERPTYQFPTTVSSTSGPDPKIPAENIVLGGHLLILVKPYKALVKIYNKNLNGLRIGRAVRMSTREINGKLPLGVLGLRLTTPIDFDALHLHKINFFRQVIGTRFLINNMFGLKLDATGNSGILSLGEQILEPGTSLPPPIIIEGDEGWRFLARSIDVYIATPVHRFVPALSFKYIVVDTGDPGMIFSALDYIQIKETYLKPYYPDYLWDLNGIPCDVVRKAFGRLRVRIVTMDYKEIIIGNLIKTSTVQPGNCYVTLRQYPYYQSRDQIGLGIPLFMSYYTEFHFTPSPDYNGEPLKRELRFY